MTKKLLLTTKTALCFCEVVYRSKKQHTPFLYYVLHQKDRILVDLLMMTIFLIYMAFITVQYSYFPGSDTNSPNSPTENTKQYLLSSLNHVVAINKTANKKEAGSKQQFRCMKY